jgi:hypothetical protein
MTDPRAAQRAEQRKQLLILVGLVVLVDAFAIAAYYLTGIKHMGPGVQLAFAIGWTVATFAVVVVSLRKIRLARRGGR